MKSYNNNNNISSSFIDQLFFFCISTTIIKNNGKLKIINPFIEEGNEEVGSYKEIRHFIDFCIVN